MRSGRGSGELEEGEGEGEGEGGGEGGGEAIGVMVLGGALYNDDAVVDLVEAVRQKR